MISVYVSLYRRVFVTNSNLFSIATVFFLVTNPIGNSPTILALVKDFPFERQKIILLRETFIALLIALFFQFFGEMFMDVLRVKNYTVTLTGGILLFLVALNMIFSLGKTTTTETSLQEPMIVPIATPLLSGPGLLTIIMLYSNQEADNLKIFSAILLAWVGVLFVMLVAPHLQKLLGKRGMTALEQLMGLLLALMAMQMIVKGGNLFMETLTAS